MEQGDSGEPRLFYTHPNGTLWVGDCVRWLESLEPASVDMVFADPPYNIGKADWDEFALHDEYLQWSLRWIEQAARVLKPHGSLYVCGFSEILADLRRPAAELFAGCKWLVWFYKNKANLTKDWGCFTSPFCIIAESKDHVQRGRRVNPLRETHSEVSGSPSGGVKPVRYAKPGREDWQPHPQGAKPKDVFEIPVTSNGMPEKTPHPTQKPEELIRKLVVASSNEGDLVVDPFSGSGTTIVCAEQLKRKWMGCDSNAEYCSWAVMRLEQVPCRSVEDRIELDRKTASRRESIR